MLYAAKCYWPGVTETELKQVAARTTAVDAGSSRDGVAYIGSLLFAADDLVLCMFEGPSRTAVKHAGDLLGVPCERLMDAIWLQPDRCARRPIAHFIRRSEPD